MAVVRWIKKEARSHLPPDPERETAERACSKCGPHIVFPVEPVKFFITA